MKLIDLHVHSTASDGTFAPSAIVAMAIRKDISAIALTDHDTLAGIPEAQKAADGTGLELIPGIELSCSYESEEIHILGLYVNDRDPVFSEELTRLLALRELRNDEMIRRFCQAGMAITRRELTFGNENTVITRAHFARLLVEKGYIATRKQAFNRYLTYGSHWCPKKEGILPDRAISILRSNGAFPVLAHPCQYRFGNGRLNTLIAALRAEGLMGLEVYHSSNQPYESQKLLSLARQYGLLPTGGSDFHGDNKPDIELGKGRKNLQVPIGLLDEIKKRRSENS